MKTKVDVLFSKGKVDELVPIMQNDIDWLYRLDAAEALAKLQDPRGRDYLNKSLHSSNSDIREVAEEMLSELNAESEDEMGYYSEGVIETDVKNCPKCYLFTGNETKICPRCNYDFIAGEKPEEAPIETFMVYQPKGFKKRIAWTVNLTSTRAEFICEETESWFSVSRDRADAEIKFAETGRFIIITEGKIATINGATFDFGRNKSRLERWLPPKSVDEMVKDLRGWGIGMIGVGIMSFAFSNFLNPIWGAVLVILGLVNLLVRNRVMFIIDGIVLIVVGILNIGSVVSAVHSTYGTISAIGGVWFAAGFLQIGWGVQEIRKYSRYAPAK